MADDVNVVLSVTERGLDAVNRDVEALRSELQELGVDMANIERRLGGIERAATSSARAVQNYAKATKESSTAAKEELQARSNLAQAASQSARAEYDLNRARNQRSRSNAAAEWDREFEALNRVTGAQENLIQSRYALYDVANAYSRIGIALAGAATYAVTVGAQFESSFTSVERTLETGSTVEEIDDIRRSLVQLSGQIPLTFDQISQIATLGNQLGLGAEDVVDFTQTVARFASVSGLSIEAVSNAFGGFLAQTGLAPRYLENLGSSIALVGINSNATEAQIVSLVREIAAGTATAGFAADEIVGLAGALASFQVAPERARGVLDTYFGSLNKAVAEGGERLEIFARLTGNTTAELDKLVRAGRGGEIFRDVLSGLQEFSPDAVELTKNLDAIGLSGLRAGNTFTRFLGQLQIADKAFADANRGFLEGAELSRQYGYTVDDLSSQFQIFINGLNGLAAAVSGGAVTSLAELFAGINNVIFALTDFIDGNQFVAGLGALIIGFVAVTGAVLTFRALLLAGTAATYAMRTALANVGGQALATAGTLRGLVGALAGVRSGAVGAAGGITVLRSAIRGLLASTGIGLAVTLLGDFVGGLFDTGGQAQSAALNMQEYNAAMADMKRGSDAGTESLGGLTDGLGDTGKSAVAAAKDVRTLVDYVQDLTGVFRRSRDLRFGQEEAFDEITLAWIKINEESEKYRQTVRSLTADRRLQSYFLEIAELYDDQVRASEIRENIAKIDDELAVAQAGASTELEGNSKAAIENRKVFRDLLGSYEDYVTALSSAGASQEQIQAVISQLNKDFGTQATALGFSGSEVGRYQARFQDLGTIIERLPRNIDVAFNPDPALQALNEFFAEAEARAAQSGSTAGGNFSDGIGAGIGDFLDDDPFEPFYVFAGQSAEASGQPGGWFGGILAGLQELGGEFQKAGDGFLTYWNEQFGEIGALFSNPGEFLSKWFDEQVTEIQETFEGVPGFFEEKFGKIRDNFETGGLDAGTKFNGGLNAALGASSAIEDFLNRQNGQAYARGEAVGSNIGGGIAAGIRNAIAASAITTASNSLSNALRGISGFATGGYTGAGHWLQPAGIVHKGEYVVPKKHVDQRTGLPDMGYLSSLRSARPAAQAGYASGGLVGGIPSSFELGAASIGALANALSVRLNVGREQLAASVSQGDSRLAWQGSN